MRIDQFFASPVYIIHKPEFIASVMQVSEEKLSKIKKDKKLDEIYPVFMSDGNYSQDPRIKNFADFIGNTSWNILNQQGYAMNHYNLTFTEMWTQEHHKHSSMDQHVHSGSHMVGFYFLEVPENSSKVIFHDPRIAKTMAELPEADVSKVTIASNMINFTPKPGMLIIANAWLAHSFTRNASDKPIKFVHFNLTAIRNQNNNATTAEII